MSLLNSIGWKVRLSEIYEGYKKNHLPWWRRLLWPRLTRNEKRIALSIAYPAPVRPGCDKLVEDFYSGLEEL